MDLLLFRPLNWWTVPATLATFFFANHSRSTVRGWGLRSTFGLLGLPNINWRNVLGTAERVNRLELFCCGERSGYYFWLVCSGQRLGSFRLLLLFHRSQILCLKLIRCFWLLFLALTFEFLFWRSLLDLPRLRRHAWTFDFLCNYFSGFTRTLQLLCPSLHFDSLFLREHHTSFRGLHYYDLPALSPLTLFTLHPIVSLYCQHLPSSTSQSLPPPLIKSY